MRVTITHQLVANTAQDGSAVPFAISVYDDSSEPWVLAVPTSLRYRLDAPSDHCSIVGWTTVTPASTATVTITGAQNTLNYSRSPQLRQLVVQVDNGLATSYVATKEFYVRNLVGVYT